MKSRFLLTLFAIAALAVIPLAIAQQNSSSAASPEVAKALEKFNPNAIRAHIKFLSDDLLEGRGPGTRGGELAIMYIAAQFESMGLEPAAADGSYIQDVPLIGIETLTDKSPLAFVKGSEKLPLAYRDDIVATDQTQQPQHRFDNDLVFVGHGVVAPEYKWDDYKGLDVKDKVLVMLVDDPPANEKEPNLFGGNARTYYGRWSYKYEIAAQKGAAGVILIHTDEAAGYPWEVVRNSWGKETSYLKANPNEPHIRIASWITGPTAGKLMKMSGHDLAVLTKAAASRTFKPVPLGVQLSGEIVSNVREVKTANVVAKITGSDPALSSQAVIYSAHHDHLGIGTPKNGDAIYNGAVDNASGVAELLEIARVWSLSPRPKRTILFAAVAAEEQGLLGSAYYAAHPLVAPGKTALHINFDSIDQLGPVRNVTMNGVERTTFFPTAQRIAAAMNLRIDGDEHPEQGSYYRSDHFSLAKVGIPAFSIHPGSDYVGKPEGWGAEQFREFNKNSYHQPSDEFNPNWDFREGAQIGQLGYWLGWDAANSADLPTWKQGDEFLAARAKSQAATTGE